MDLSIIIVNWNTQDLLRTCLRSIYAHPTRHAIEVIVVDNASSDGSAEMVQREFPQVRVVANDYNYGFAVATNQGYRMSCGRYVMTLNPDTEVFEGALNALVEFLEDHAEVGLVAPGVVDERGVLQQNFSHTCRWPLLQTPYVVTRIASLWRRENARLHLPADPFEVATAWGTGLTCRRAALASGHFFEERTFLFCEEDWLCDRLRRRGYKVCVLPKALIRHLGGAGRSRTIGSAYVCALLMVAAQYVLRKEMFGAWNAKVNSFLSLADSATVWVVVRCRALLRRPSTSRVVALAWLAGFVVGSFKLLVYGDRYAQDVNRRGERFFNTLFLGGQDRDASASRPS